MKRSWNINLQYFLKYYTEDNVQYWNNLFVSIILCIWRGGFNFNQYVARRSGRRFLETEKLGLQHSGSTFASLVYQFSEFHDFESHRRPLGSVVTTIISFRLKTKIRMCALQLQSQIPS